MWYFIIIDIVDVDYYLKENAVIVLIIGGERGLPYSRYFFYVETQEIRSIAQIAYEEIILNIIVNSYEISCKVFVENKVNSTHVVITIFYSVKMFQIIENTSDIQSIL